MLLMLTAFLVWLLTGLLTREQRPRSRTTPRTPRLEVRAVAPKFSMTVAAAMETCVSKFSMTVAAAITVRRRDTKKANAPDG